MKNHRHHHPLKMKDKNPVSFPSNKFKYIQVEATSQSVVIIVSVFLSVLNGALVHQ